MLITYALYALGGSGGLTGLLVAFPGFRHWLAVKLGISDPYLNEILDGLESKTALLQRHSAQAASAKLKFEELAKKHAEESDRAGRVAEKLKTLTS